MASTVSSIRIDEAVKSRIRRAASTLGISYNEFIASSAAERADLVLGADKSLPSNLARVLAAASGLEVRDHAQTAASTIGDPFPGLIEREARLRK